jgi:tetratricopeptide (TPR) repeat protein
MVHGMVLYLARYYDRAVEELAKVVELEPQHVLANFFLGVTYKEKGRYEEALAHVQKAAELTGNAPFFVQGMGYILAAAGRKEQAQTILAKLGEMTSKAYVWPFSTALIHFQLGEEDRGFEWLDKAFADGDHWLEFIKVYPDLDGVRSDPRYDALLKKLKLE